MFNVITGVVTVVIAIAGIKFKSDAQAQDLKEQQSQIKTCFKKYDDLHKQVTENKVKLEHMPTSQQIKNEYVSIEVFKEMKENLDIRFKGLENGISKILNKLDERKT